MAKKKSTASKKAPPRKKKTASTRKASGDSRVRDTGRYDPHRATSQEEYPEDHSPREKYMSLGDHLEELRRRIIVMIVVVVVFSLAIGFFIREIHDFLMQPYLEATAKDFPGTKLYLKKVSGSLIVIIKLSITLGFTASLPILINILWGFVTPAVSRFTTIIGHLTVAASSLLFWSGIAICWTFILRFALKFFLRDYLLPHVNPMVSLEEYYGFLLWIHIGTGLGFQLPLINVILGAMGILTVDWHKRSWKYILVSIFVFSAFITPPDPITQSILGGALTLLYGVSILIIWIMERARRRPAQDYT